MKGIKKMVGVMFLGIAFGALIVVGLIATAICLSTEEFEKGRDKAIALSILLLFTLGNACCLAELISSCNQPGKLVRTSTETVIVDKDTLFEIQSDNASESFTYSISDKNLPVKIAASKKDISVKNKGKNIYSGKIAVDGTIDNGANIKSLKIERKTSKKNIFLLGQIEVNEDSATALSK